MTLSVSTLPLSSGMSVNLSKGIRNLVQDQAVQRSTDSTTQRRGPKEDSTSVPQRTTSTSERNTAPAATSALMPRIEAQGPATGSVRPTRRNLPLPSLRRPRVGSTISCVYGKGLVVRHHAEHQQLVVHMLSWRLSGHSKVTCYLNTSDVQVIRPQETESTIPYRVEQVQDTGTFESSTTTFFEETKEYYVQDEFEPEPPSSPTSVMWVTRVSDIKNAPVLVKATTTTVVALETDTKCKCPSEPTQQDFAHCESAAATTESTTKPKQQQSSSKKVSFSSDPPRVREFKRGNTVNGATTVAALEEQAADWNWNIAGLAWNAAGGLGLAVLAVNFVLGTSNNASRRS